MSAAILISSSPPPVFARSPTPVEVSSPLPSPSSLFRGRSSSLFKPAQKQRDGIAFGFTSARSLLTTRVGGENLPLRSSPGKDKFKSISPQPSNVDVASSPRLKFLSDTPGSQTKEKNYQPRSVSFRSSQTVSEVPEKVHGDAVGLPEGECDRRWFGGSLKGDENICISSLKRTKATPRRTDWTPARSGSPGPSTGSPNSPLQAMSLGHAIQTCSFVDPVGDNPARKQEAQVAISGQQSKSGCVDPVTIGGTLVEVSIKPGVGRDLRKPPTRKRNKSPAKKPLTITALATSNYGEKPQGRKLTTMQDYVSATQVNANDESEPLTGPSAKSRSKAPGKKSRTTKKAPPKSRLQSPTSALKAVESQEVVFGSASQLVREESPTLLRETLEAIRQSESMLSSDPFSPQRTQPISIEATSPRNLPGTSRYVKRRNLWGIAGRDEDNALLQVDTIDLIDSPAVREALAGKDVLVQPGVQFLANNRSAKKQNISFQAQQTPLNHKSTLLLDIDDIVTPSLPVGGMAILPPQKRTIHTSPPSQQPRKSTQSVGENNEKAATSKKPSPAKAKQAPVKPSYAGFSTGDLQKQISAFGFKAVKSRDKMIELLDRCWEDKHGPAPNDSIDQDSVETLTHGDFLSKVHDITARPVPKAKKPRKRKSEGTELKTPKEPKRRKKAEPKQKDAEEKPKKPKLVRKPAAKLALSKEFVVDVDDIDDSNIETNVASKASVSVSESVSKTKTALKKRTSKGNEAAKIQEAALSPLPATTRHSSPPLPESHSSIPVGTTTAIDKEASQGLTGDDTKLDVDAIQPLHTPPLPDIKDQIGVAITFESRLYSSLGAGAGARNHAKHPTWREKMLMFDPIVLEDLTRWLNTEGFRSIGEDREINPLEVRTWCEENGVCNLWKGGWRGRRKGGGDD
ncbi:hypothetical protein PV08_03288 [Exophiala spinifera]|uniref:Structure-specific endonuclease subunit SLX4 n=1 Tax=Exophiala spinifera TaxID=91928 RepID=A0A0D2BJE0_9EURO|nr:uncharacterized protein PV08_03288 [Exophiala spinifera]KIW18998.1 hypothetical protein PV08_03288 [Exophiala spinifera]